MATDTDHPELLKVDVPRDVARRAARMADEHDLAMEDALARLTAFDYPTDAVAAPTAEVGGCSGP